MRQKQQPAEVQRLLESYISHAAILPKGVYQIRTAGSVPEELRRLVMQAVKLGKTWSCWTQGIRTWLFTAELALPLSRELDAPVLQVNLYADDGSLLESDALMTDAAGKWAPVR